MNFLTALYRGIFASAVALTLLAVVPAAQPAGSPAASAKTKDKKAKAPGVPRHDPIDQPFRFVPMAEATRSVVIPLATNLFVAFDTELLRTHVAWEGQPLNLWGTPYHLGKDRFYGDFDGKVLWKMPPVFPWSVGKIPDEDATMAPTGARFLGLSTKGISGGSGYGMAVLRYELPLQNGKSVLIHEMASERAFRGILRRFEIAPCAEDLWFLAHAEPAATGAISNLGVTVVRQSDKIRIIASSSFGGLKMDPPPERSQTTGGRPGGGVITTNKFRIIEGSLGGVEWATRNRDVNYVSRFWTEEKNESVFNSKLVKHPEARAYLKIPAHSEAAYVEIMTKVLTLVDGDMDYDQRLMNRLVANADMDFVVSSKKQFITFSQTPSHVFSGEKTFSPPAGDPFFRLEHFPVPKEIQLQVTGMDFLPSGDLAVCTWLGEVYIVEQPTGAPGAAKYRRFARGLCEPCGLKVIEGEIYVVQKQQLTRLRDTDGNGEADLFECINQDWPFTGNYHDFSFGPTLDRDGNFHIFRIGAHGIFDMDYMGWDIAISRDGRTLTPFCSGLRSANGFGNYRGDIFMVENQGNWMGAGKLNHLQKGRFYGYPSAKPAPREQFDKPTRFDPPAVWFPYGKPSKSASGLAEITDDRFGPFKGQLLVGEFQNAAVMRVFLEKVNGEWQGCVWPFAKGFDSGVNRLAFGPDGKLYVGGLKNAAWAAVAPKDYSLDRVTWTGKVPFEVKEVHARKDGFELTFTEPVDPATAGKADNWDISQFNYEYHQKYGSPEYDFDGKPDSASAVKVVRATVAADNLSVRLNVEGWRTNFIATIRALDVTNADGKPLRNDTFYYTLNQIPR